MNNLRRVTSGWPYLVATIAVDLLWQAVTRLAAITNNFSLIAFPGPGIWALPLMLASLALTLGYRRGWDQITIVGILTVHFGFGLAADAMTGQLDLYSVLAWFPVVVVLQILPVVIGWSVGAVIHTSQAPHPTQ